MLTGIALGGLALFVTVFLTYWLAISRGVPLDTARTGAFTAWILGHVLLAYVSRSAHDPLYRIGLFTNRVMLLWAAGAFAFLILVLMVPLAGQKIGIVSISAGSIALIAGTAIVCMGGFELVKIIRR
jgi:Ca2+-transporting ATPase